MIKLLNTDKFLQEKKVTQPVTSPNIFIGKAGGWHPQGLFSEEIFGVVGSNERKSKYSYIDINCYCIHPAIYELLVKRLWKKLPLLLSNEIAYRIEKDGSIVEDPDGELNNFTSLIENIKRIKIRTFKVIEDDEDVTDSEKLMNMVEFYIKKNLFFIDKLIVIPPDYRKEKFENLSEEDIQQRLQDDTPDMNQIYIKIISISHQLKNVSGELYNILSYKMQQAIRDMYEYINVKIGKKGGIIRSHILSRHVDYSGREVIIPDASLPLGYVGLPLKLVCSIFEPNLMYGLVNSKEAQKIPLEFHIAVKEYLGKEQQSMYESQIIYEEDEQTQIIADALLGDVKTEEKIGREEIKLLLFLMGSKGYKVPKIILDTVYDTAVREVEDKHKVVIIKRDPDVHSDRVQAVYVKIIKNGTAMKIHPATKAPFGLDFDGDTMAVYVPISEQSQKQARERMVKLHSNEGIKKQLFTFDKEILIGLFFLTAAKEIEPRKTVKTVEEARKMHPGQQVKYSGINTTAGRVVFNEVGLLNYLPFINEETNKKKIESILSQILEKSESKYAAIMDNLMRLGFEYDTRYPKTYAIDQFKINAKLEKLRLDMGKEKDVTKQYIIQEEIEKELYNYLKSIDSDLYYMLASGGTKGANQIRQVMVCKGLLQDPDGNVLPAITTPTNEGLSTKEYFDSAAGSRKGTIDRSINTAKGGYSYRKVVFAAGNVKLNINKNDCGVKHGINIKLTEDLFKRLGGRYIVTDDGIVKPITSKMIGKIIDLRSPIYCRSLDLCKTCYGDLIYQIKATHVGMIAASQAFSLSEKIMKSFHLGGALQLEIMDFYKELMENIPDEYIDVLKKLLKQEGNDLICLDEDAMIEIEKKAFIKSPMEEDDDKYILPAGHLTIKIGDISIPVTIEKKTTVYKTDAIEETDTFIFVTYLKGDKMMYVGSEKEDVTKLANEIDTMLSGKSPWTTPESLFLKTYKRLRTTGNFDTVHLEVVISNVLRNRKEPQKPARVLTPYDPIVVPIKKLPSTMSWVLGLEFENFNQAIQTGLINDRAPASALEQILMGESLMEEK